MATKKQISANRRNAKKSTGPKTAAGKAKSAQNATKHGLLARQLVLSDEDGAEYEALRLSLIHELWPETPLEQLIVERIAAAQWRLARVPVIETELFAALRVNAMGRKEGLGAAWARDAGPSGGALARLARYETMLERSAARLLAELRRSQAERSKAERGEAAREAQPGRGGEWWQRAAAAWPGAPGPLVSPALGGGRGEAPAPVLAEFPNEAEARPAPASLVLPAAPSTRLRTGGSTRVEQKQQGARRAPGQREA